MSGNCDNPGPWIGGSACMLACVLLSTAGPAVSADTPPDGEAITAFVAATDGTDPDTPARGWLEDRPTPDTSDWSAKRIAEYEAQRASVTPHALPEGLLRIPAVNIEVPVFAGTEERHLTLGAGRIDGTPPLATGGNTGLAAHRDGFFRAVKDVSIDDAIFVETASGIHEYRIVDLFVVTPDAVHVLDSTGRDSITIVTCYPFYFVGNAPQRFIVRAERR